MNIKKNVIKCNQRDIKNNNNNKYILKILQNYNNSYNNKLNVINN